MVVVILERAYALGITISPTFVCSEENWLTDKASRFKVPKQWCLKQAVFDSICCVYGVPDVDIMASEGSAKRPMYVSWEKDEGALTVNALARDVEWKVWKRVYVSLYLP